MELLCDIVAEHNFKSTSLLVTLKCTKPSTHISNTIMLNVIIYDAVISGRWGLHRLVIFVVCQLIIQSSFVAVCVQGSYKKSVTCTSSLNWANESVPDGT